MSLKPALNPKTWSDLLASHAARGDTISCKTLLVVLESLEVLKNAQANGTLQVSSLQVGRFEQLQKSFNSPRLLKEVGILFLREFRLYSQAHKFFELVEGLSPHDPDLQTLKNQSILALAEEATGKALHSTIEPSRQTKPIPKDLIRKTQRVGAPGMSKAPDKAETMPEVKPEAKVEEKADKGAGKVDQKVEPSDKPAEEKPQSKLVAAEMPLPPEPPKPVDDAYRKILTQADVLLNQGYSIPAAEAVEEARKQGAPPEEIGPFYVSLGLDAYTNNRLNEALKFYKMAVVFGPDRVENWFNCGLVQQKLRNLDDAQFCYQKAAELDPSNAKVWCSLSGINFEQGLYPKAEENARKALAIRPDYARAWDSLAGALGATDRLQEAADACHQAIHYQSNLLSAWFKLGVIYFHQDNLPAAEQAFYLASEDPAFSSYGYYYFSMIEAWRGNMDQAVTLLEQARTSDPGNELELTALKELGAAYSRLQKHSQAAEFYSLATEKDTSDYAAWISLGTACHRAEMWDQARDAYRSAIEVDEMQPMAWHNLGLLASEHSYHVEARDCFRREVDLVPQDAKAWYDLGVSLQFLGESEESSEAFKKAEELVGAAAKESDDLSAALSIVRRLHLKDRVLKT